MQRFFRPRKPLLKINLKPHDGAFFFHAIGHGWFHQGGNRDATVLVNRGPGAGGECALGGEEHASGEHACKMGVRGVEVETLAELVKDRKPSGRGEHQVGRWVQVELVKGRAPSGRHNRR